MGLRIKLKKPKKAPAKKEVKKRRTKGIKDAKPRKIYS